MSAARQLYLLALALLIGVSSPQASAMTIDIFTAAQGPADDDIIGGGGTQNSMAGPQAGNIVPATGSRDLFAEKTSGSFGRARLGVNFDVLFYTSNSGVGGYFEVAYLNLDAVDLSFGDGLTIEGEIDPSAAAGGGTTIGLYVADMSSNFGRSEVLLTSSGDFTHTFMKSDFAGVNFAEIETIRLGSFDASTGSFVDVPAGGDVIVSSLEVTAVPEPQSYAAAGLFAMIVMLGLGLLGRRRLRLRLR